MNHRQDTYCNRLLFDKQKIKEHQLHKNRLRNVKSMLDNKQPQQFTHLKHAPGKVKQPMNKFIEMQNENRILLKKMLSIDLKPSELNPQKIVTKLTPSSQSLNRVSRLKELVRVNEENRQFLNRLQKSQSSYDHRKWIKENENKNYMLDLICRNSSRFQRHPYFIRSPLQGSDRLHISREQYGSRGSARAMSANIINRQSEQTLPDGRMGPNDLLAASNFGAGLHTMEDNRPMTAPKQQRAQKRGSKQLQTAENHEQNVIEEPNIVEAPISERPVTALSPELDPEI